MKNKKENTNNLSAINHSSGETIMLFALFMILFAVWHVYTFSWFWMHLCFLALFIIDIALFLLVANINFNNRSHYFWFLFISLLFAIAVLLFEIFSVLKILNILAIISPVALLYVVVFARIVKESRTNKVDTPETTKFGTIIKTCLRSRFFISLLVLMFGTFIYILSVSKNMAVSTHEEMAGVYIFFMWIFVAILFFVILFMGMAFAIRKKRKTFRSLFLSSLFLVIILIITITACYFYMVWWSNNS
ncbi:MAG: hypothetical protein PHI66_04870 [Candidatus Pacebacteria bacterium]|nr:hypothetical protein [Candidatus Paceibacterota bacterium]